MFHSDTHIDLNQPGPKDNRPKITKNAVLASLAVSLGSMIVGFCSAWSSPAIASLMEQGSGIEVCTVWPSNVVPTGIVRRPTVNRIGDSDMKTVFNVWV